MEQITIVRKKRDKKGRIILERLSDGTIRKYAYDKKDRETYRRIERPNGSVLEVWTDYDADGLRHERTSSGIERWYDKNLDIIKTIVSKEWLKQHGDIKQ
jgi:YD repeat-containing protein